MSERLWEVDHPYYCNEAPYSNPGGEGPQRYRTWAEFAEEEDQYDMDLNLVFRFDWREGEDWELQAFNGDEYYRNGELWVFWMGQRKGLFRATVTEVCRADEPAVREWLQTRLDHLMKIWAPLSPSPQGVEASS